MSEPITLAPGLAWALGQIEDDGSQGQRRRGPDPRVTLREWMTNGARTRLGRMVINGDITTFEQAVASRMPIREPEIVDAFFQPNLFVEMIGRPRRIQRMTDSGQRTRFNVMVVVGNKDGVVGLATSKGKEVATTIQKATNQAKLNMITVRRGNGSWESGGGPGRSVPMKITGRAGSTRITLMPAPTGKGLVIGDTGRMILEMAGITDVWSSSKGQTRTQYNFARSTFNALKQANLARISRADVERLHISRGGMS
ncbi:MAG: 30S ribosomal protein S5 [Candidatus Thalassarchaeaceae archaeon]|tara:strand:- start:3455 stop:4219 length:765 start_codon:yes stop_codon:yes gene_type:complete